MGTYYVDTTLADGNEDGSSWANAWHNLQDAIDQKNQANAHPVAGDVVYCYSNGATNPDSGMIDVDDTECVGSSTAYVKFIGCADKGTPPTVDGTYYVIDGTGVDHCLSFAEVADYMWFENFELKNADSDGLDMSGSPDYNIYINIYAHDCGGVGIMMGGSYSRFFFCRAINNDSHGFQLNGGQSMFFSVSEGNSGDGFEGVSWTLGYLIGCLSHNNASIGFEGISNYNVLFNCVADGETTGMELDGDRCFILASRITNCTNGIDFNTFLSIAGFNYFHNNTNDVVDATRAFNLTFEQAVTNHVMSGGIEGSNKIDVDADDGYENRAADDFNLKADRTYNGDGSDTVGLNIGS